MAGRRELAFRSTASSDAPTEERQKRKNGKWTQKKKDDERDKSGLRFVLSKKNTIAPINKPTIIDNNIAKQKKFSLSLNLS